MRFRRGVNQHCRFADKEVSLRAVRFRRGVNRVKLLDMFQFGLRAVRFCMGQKVNSNSLFWSR